MVLPYQWAQLVKAMNIPELAEDGPFPPTRRARPRHTNQALAALIENGLSRFASREEAMAALEAERVPCAPVLTLHEAMAHRHLRERGTVRCVADHAIGEFDIPGLAAKFSRWPAAAALTPTVWASIMRTCCATSSAFPRRRSKNSIGQDDRSRSSA